MNAPLETEDQARELPAVRAVWEAVHAIPRRGVMAEQCHKMMEDACTAAGVQIGAYDHRILIWLSGWEPQICAVVAGLVTRAAAGHGLSGERLATVSQALADALEYRRAATGFCADCDRAEGGLCADHVEDETRATAYLALAGTLGIPLEDR